LKIKIRKISIFKIIGILFSIVTIIFGVLSILNLENWIMRIIMQASLCLTLLINGIDILGSQKNKKTGYFLLGVSALNLFVMVFTFFVGFKTGKI